MHYVPLDGPSQPISAQPALRHRDRRHFNIEQFRRRQSMPIQYQNNSNPEVSSIALPIIYDSRIFSKRPTKSCWYQPDWDVSCHVQLNLAPRRMRRCGFYNPGPPKSN